MRLAISNISQTDIKVIARLLLKKRDIVIVHTLFAAKVQPKDVYTKAETKQ
jgi:hypothetical protein